MVTLRCSLVVCVSVLCGCASRGPGWSLDAKYSAELTVLAPNPEGRVATAASDVVRIYHAVTERDDVLAPESLPQGSKESELNDRNAVAEFLAALQSPIPDESDTAKCFENRGKDLWHVFVFDNESMRIAEVLIRRCSTSERQQFAIIMPMPQSLRSSMYFNKNVLVPWNRIF
jgi:hypothetical protein